ncbi:hypothetical protein NW062_00820 [Mycoplasmopsis cynos]|nr:hypothetical protein NW062_00820 [Mycoplasmopsis cynos]
MEIIEYIWGKTATESWKFDRDNKWYAGQFIWTGFDYIGEPTPWYGKKQWCPKSSYFGIVDTMDFRKWIIIYINLND